MGTLSVTMMEVYGPARRQLLSDASQAPRFLDEHEQILSTITAGESDQPAIAVEQHLTHAQQALERTLF